MNHNKKCIYKSHQTPPLPPPLWTQEGKGSTESEYTYSSEIIPFCNPGLKKSVECWIKNFSINKTFLR